MEPTTKKKLHKVAFAVPTTIHTVRMRYKGGWKEQPKENHRRNDKIVWTNEKTSYVFILVLKKRWPFSFNSRLIEELLSNWKQPENRIVFDATMENEYTISTAAAFSRSVSSVSLPKDVRLDERKWKMLNAYVIPLNWHINWWLYVSLSNLNSFLLSLTAWRYRCCWKAVSGEWKMPERPTSIHRTYKYLAHILVVAV